MKSPWDDPQPAILASQLRSLLQYSISGRPSQQPANASVSKLSLNEKCRCRPNTTCAPDILRVIYNMYREHVCVYLMCVHAFSQVIMNLRHTKTHTLLNCLLRTCGESSDIFLSYFIKLNVYRSKTSSPCLCIVSYEIIVWFFFSLYLLILNIRERSEEPSTEGSGGEAAGSAGRPGLDRPSPLGPPLTNDLPLFIAHKYLY